MSFELGFAHHGCSIFDSGTDTCVSTATANIASHSGVNVFVAGVFVFAEQCSSAHELTRLAIATLGNLVFDPSFLQRVGTSSAQAFDGADFLASSSADLGLARTDSFAVDMHGTCAAQASTATKFGSGHAEFIAENPQQRGICVGVGINGFTVDLKLKAHEYFLD
jgi:hypothetical protein